MAGLKTCNQTLPTRYVFLVLVLALLPGLPISTRAAVGGSIFGTVKDRTGAVVPKAPVTATNLETGVRQTAATNGAGVFSFPGLPVGRYDVDITVAGFKPYRRAGMTVDV